MVEQSQAGAPTAVVAGSASAESGEAVALAAARLRGFVAAGAGRWLDAETDAALAVIDAELAAIAARLRVRHVGPAVGMIDMQAEPVYRIVIDAHVLNVVETRWCAYVCDATDYAGFRPTWPLTGVGRLRRVQVAGALSGLVSGYREAVDAHPGPADVAARRRLEALDAALAG